MLKLPADVVLGSSDGGGARKERESGGDCLDSSDVLSLSIRNNIIRRIKMSTINTVEYTWVLSSL
jgi:hypothetical protein